MSLARFGSVWVGLARLARFGSFRLLALTEILLTSSELVLKTEMELSKQEMELFLQISEL